VTCRCSCFWSVPTQLKYRSAVGGEWPSFVMVDTVCIAKEKFVTSIRCIQVWIILLLMSLVMEKLNVCYVNTQNGLFHVPYTIFFGDTRSTSHQTHNNSNCMLFFVCKLIVGSRRAPLSTEYRRRMPQRKEHSRARPRIKYIKLYEYNMYTIIFLSYPYISYLASQAAWFSGPRLLYNHANPFNCWLPSFIEVCLEWHLFLRIWMVGARAQNKFVKTSLLQYALARDRIPVHQHDNDSRSPPKWTLCTQDSLRCNNQLFDMEMPHNNQAHISFDIP
jgi:hypothetical protein